MKDFIKIEADTPEEMEQFIELYRQRKKGKEKKGKKMYRELLSFLMNDIIPRLEVLGRFYNDPHILIEGEKIQVNLAKPDDDIDTVTKNLKDFITKSVLAV